MLRVKLREYTVYLEPGFCRYEKGMMVRNILGTIQRPRVPPFRDPESLLFIHEVDRGRLVKGDWYSYVSPFGRTCMSSLSGGTQYALTLIYYSRRNVYTTYEPYGEDIWQRLQGLDMDILVAYDPNHWGGGLVRLPWTMKGCIVENVSVGGVVYKEAVYDTELGKNYMDDAGIFHFDGCLYDHKWIWGDHLKEIFEYFAREAAERAFLVELEPVLFPSPDYCYDTEWHREVFCCSDTFPKGGGFIDYPRILQIKKYSDDTYTAEEICSGKYPNIYEALDRAVKGWNNDCIATFSVVIEAFGFDQLRDFFRDRLWYFEDDGKAVHVYSGIKGLRRLMEFVGNSWKDGRMCAVEKDSGH